MKPFPAFVPITSTITLGRAPENVGEILALGVESVVAVTNEQRPAEFLSDLPSTIERVVVPLEDHRPIPEPLLTGAVLELAQTQCRGRRTLLHCTIGQSRSPTVLALYLMGVEHASWEDAIARLKRLRPLVDPHPMLTTPDSRARVVATLRAYLDGSVPHLLAHLRTRGALIR